MKDYAKSENRGAWLCHPTLGDPSFDTFQKLGDTIHKSQPPLEWGVNGSLFADPKSGNWYLYAGLYPFGYRIGPDFASSTFCIYRSQDRGKHWECLGPGMGEFVLKGRGCELTVRNHPDAAVIYDPESDRYLMAYDFSSGDSTWESAHDNTRPDCDSGAGLAYSDSPEGPFYPLETPFFSNLEQRGKLGHFSRGYASTVLKRAGDYIAFILCDSGQHFAWGLACMTAQRPEGPWSEPHMLLSAERGDYYPAPVEFYPCFVQGGRVYAPATSVARNRNYQAVFSAPLELAHQPSAWRLDFDGGFWHSRPLSDEAYGIWGQTIHGFVENGTFYCMYPAKDERNFGTISLASRPWDQPFSDGFTFSGHAGDSISLLLAAYRDFSLEAECALTGTVEFAFDYRGILGPSMHSAEAVPHAGSFSDYCALVLKDQGAASIIRQTAGIQEVLFASEEAFDDAKRISFSLVSEGGRLSVQFDGRLFWSGAMPLSGAWPLALIARPFSILQCTKFKITGAENPYEYRLNAFDALLGAGQLLSDWQSDSNLSFAGPCGFIGQGNVRGKWNFIGNGFTIFAPKSPALGAMDIYVDGNFYGTALLNAASVTPSAPIYRIDGLPQGRHGVVIKPRSGKIALDLIAVQGKPENEDAQKLPK